MTFSRRCVMVRFRKVVSVLQHGKIISLSRSQTKVVLGAKAMQAIYFSTPTTVINTPPVPEEGGKCLRKRCKGRIRLAYPDDSCTCFIVAPCSRCLSSYFECDTCFENQGDLYERIYNCPSFAHLTKRRRKRVLQKIKNDQKTAA